MKIEKVVQYRVGGKMFPDVYNALAHVENLIGLHIDKMCRECTGVGTKDKLLIYDYMIKNGKELANLLLCEYEDDEDWQGVNRNVFLNKTKKQAEG